MRKLGKELEFISFVKRDGSGNIPVDTEWTRYSDHPRTDNVSYMDGHEFEINTLSLSQKTFIASGFNTWVVRLKN